MRRNRSNQLTVILSLLILFSGIVLPNLIYPMLDPFMEQITLLEVSAEGGSGIVFSGPPSLYPMDHYDTSNTRPLNSEERQLLISLGITDLLLSMMQSRNMQIEGMEQVFADRLLAAFEYLETNRDKDPPCFVIYACDIDMDGTDDLQCAVNLRGTLIFFLVLDEQWSKVVIPDDLASDDQPEEPVDPPTEETPDLSTTSPDGQSEISVPDSSDDLLTADGDTELPDDTGNQVSILPPDRLPLTEHYAIWAFSYNLTQEAFEANQNYLADSFRYIDLNFSHNYRYSFESLLMMQNGQNPKDDDIVYDSSYVLNPQIYSYDAYNYILYVYDLEDATRIIFYIDANSSACMGFIIQEL